MSIDTTLTGGAGAGAGAGAGTLDPSQSTLSANFAPYVYDMLLKGQTAANLPFQPYTGQRFAFGTQDPVTGQYSAGYSPLEQDYFNTVSGLQPPSMADATRIATEATQGLGAYTPGTFGNQFTAPGAYTPTAFSSGYTDPTLSSATQFTNQFQGPAAYTPMQFNTGLGPVGSVQDYMNPYLSSVMDVQAREARREADISRQAEQARFTQAGAYGGSRQAIMEAERQRNLATQIGDIRAQGLQAAFDRAQKQRFEEAGLGLAAQRDTEASRQFGAGQAMTAAQERARYGMDALTSAEAARQFQEQQRAGRARTAAEMQLEQQRLSDASRQFGYGKGLESAEMAARYGMDALKAGEESRQFGARYGLDTAARRLDAARTLGDIEASQFGLGLRAAQEKAEAGRAQRAIAQSPLDFGYQQWLESVRRPAEQAKEMQGLLAGLPLQAPEYQPEQSAIAAALQGLIGALGLGELID